MRGSRRAVLLVVMSTGIIPAHAGLTSMSRTHGEPTWDHPRACGAHFSRRLGEIVERDHPRACGAHYTEINKNRLWLGSSPRMRGSQITIQNRPCTIGIIPAHAGLTRMATAIARTSRDHPRACGAHTPSLTSDTEYTGSSPRMRGSPHEHQRDVLYEGIIPAHAGLTRRGAVGYGGARDHPRACGAHTDRVY